MSWRIAILQIASCVLALLFASCSSPAAPSSTAGGVDVLAYLLGEPALWPRIGSHSQHQVVDVARREVCWVKYSNPQRFECWRWDEQYVYHAVDHALDGDSNESYRFTDGRWLPRTMPRGATAATPWTIDVARNQIVWFDAACRIDPARTHAFPYRMRAWFEPRADAGGDLGRRDALLFDYEPYDPAAAAPGARERFSLGLGAGWYRWERGTFVDLFNRLGGPIVTVNRSVRCDADQAQ